MSKFTFVLATAAFSTALLAEPTDTAAVSFAIGAQQLEMPLPDGYCLPTGIMATVAQVMAASDKSNLTLATFDACNDGNSENGMSRYVLIKVPNTAITAVTTKDQAFPALEAAFNAPTAPKFDAAMQEKVESGYRDTLGTSPTFTGNFGYSGKDADCLYLAGQIVVAGEGRTVPMHASTCITVAGSRIVTINSYAVASLRTVAELQAQSRAIAVSIRAR